jgi:hypothetical protein
MPPYSSVSGCCQSWWTWIEVSEYTRNSILCAKAVVGCSEVAGP